jgi:ribonucleotide monophosphatase NagD (HAD superfamily)
MHCISLNQEKWISLLTNSHKSMPQTPQRQVSKLLSAAKRNSITSSSATKTTASKHSYKALRLQNPLTTPSGRW